MENTTPQHDDKRLTRKTVAKVAVVGTVSALATIYAGNKLLQNESQASNEQLEIRNEPAIVDFERESQRLYTRKSFFNKNIVVRCDPPEPIEKIEGMPIDRVDFDWSKLELPRINISGDSVPLLTSRTDIGQDTIDFLEGWYNDPNFVNKQLDQIETPLKPSPSIGSLVVHYKQTRNQYWKQNGQVCDRVFDNSPTNNPYDLHRDFTNTLKTFSGGAIEYGQKEFITIEEKDLPLTADPSLTSPTLISWYKRSMNYQSLAEMAVARDVSTVFTYSGPSGMFESTTWKEKKSGKEIKIFGFNYEVTYDQAVHSWLHFLENKLKNSPLKDIYKKVVGRDQEYQSLPYYDYDLLAKNMSAMNSGQQYAGVGIGTIHLAPNSLMHYEFDSTIPVKVPGYIAPVNNDLWGGGEQIKYFEWWLKSLPKKFFSVIN